MQLKLVRLYEPDYAREFSAEVEPLVASRAWRAVLRKMYDRKILPLDQGGDIVINRSVREEIFRLNIRDPLFKELRRLIRAPTDSAFLEAQKAQGRALLDFLRAVPTLRWFH